MRDWAGNHVLLLTVGLSAVAVTAVFSAVGGVIPNQSVPRVSDGMLGAIPHLNAGISATAIGTILLGWRAIRRGAIRRHRACMLASFGLFTAFLGGYLYRLVLAGTAEFPGPDAVYMYVYLPFLAVHVLLAIVCIPLVFYAILLASTRSTEELYHTRHAQVGSIAAVLWVTSFSMGICVYVMLHHVW